jgi:branched-chain amino acid aminotransferase
MSRFLWVNASLTDAPAIDPRDRGFTLGDGLFETVRALGGRLPLLSLHLARLRTSAERIGLPLPWTDAFLAAAVSSVLSANALSDAAVRLTVSRGVPSRRGLLPDPRPTPTLVIAAEPFSGYPDLHARGADLVTSQLRRDERSPLAAVKSLSRLEHVLARQDAGRAGADEALILNTSGRVAGASAANLFVVVGGRLLTPAPDEGALPGIIRGLVLMELAPAAGVAACEEPVTPDDLRRADEAFLTNALLGLLPVASLDGERIGSRRSVGARLAQLLSERLRRG